MAPDDEDSDDLYDDEFDFVDDIEDDDEFDDESAIESAEDERADEGRSDEDAADFGEEPAPRETAARRGARPPRSAAADEPERESQRDEEAGDEEPADDTSRPELPTNFRVHVYEFRQYKRTIDRPFTAEDAEAFASEYNRTSKPYGRFALAGKDDVKPKKSLD